jgi:hypothetical protein
LGFRGTQVACHHLPVFGGFTHGVATNRHKRDMLTHFELSACLNNGIQYISSCPLRFSISFGRKRSDRRRIFGELRVDDANQWDRAWFEGDWTEADEKLHSGHVASA